MLKKERQQYAMAGLVKLLKTVPKTVSKDLPKGAGDDLSSNDAKQMLMFLKETDDKFADLSMFARL